MFETNFSHASASPLPPNVSIDLALQLLHDFETVIRLSPDCRGCKRIPPPPPSARNGYPKQPPSVPNGNLLSSGGINGEATPQSEIQYWEVEDDLPFMPKRLWQGGVKYTAEYLAVLDGCDITVHAPGGFTSTNHWRILRETILEDAVETKLERVKSKDLEHASGSGWYVQIVSDARCNKTFVGIVKGFLKASHVQLETAFVEKVKAEPVVQRSRRPTLGRRRSSEF